MAGVQQDHHEAFVAGAAQVASEHTGRVGGAFDGRAFVDRFDLQSARQLQRCLDLGRFGQADTVDARQLVDCCVRESRAGKRILASSA